MVSYSITIWTCLLDYCLGDFMDDRLQKRHCKEEWNSILLPRKVKCFVRERHATSSQYKREWLNVMDKEAMSCQESFLRQFGL